MKTNCQCEEVSRRNSGNPTFSGEGGCAAGSISAFGVKTFFSPMKKKGVDSRPALLARISWMITIDCRRWIVMVGGESHLVHVFDIKNHFSMNF
jgi:hypothetical protein